jgi:hypothetical protein
MSSFELLLERYEQILEYYNLSNYDKLYSPLSESEVTNYLKKLNVEDESFKSVYLWKNGFDPDEDINIHCQLNIFGAFQSLKSVWETGLFRVAESIWKETFIPIITEGLGEYLLFNNEQGNDYGKLYLYSASLSFTEPISYYDSLTAMIETDIAGYENGIFSYDQKNNWLDIDVKKYGRIAKSINKSSNYWNLV